MRTKRLRPPQSAMPPTKDPKTMPVAKHQTVSDPVTRPEEFQLTRSKTGNEQDGNVVLRVPIGIIECIDVWSLQPVAESGSQVDHEIISEQCPMGRNLRRISSFCLFPASPAEFLPQR